MEICRLRRECYIVICVILLSSTSAKPFSINKALLAANGLTAQTARKVTEKDIDISNVPVKKLKSESNLIKSKDITEAFENHVPRNKTPSTNTASKKKTNKNVYVSGERISLNNILSTDFVDKKKTKKYIDRGYPKDKYISPRKYKKEFQIYIPLKPKKLKSYKPFYKRRKQTFKRNTIANNKYASKYIPLLKNLGMLFDDLYESSSGESSYNNEEYPPKNITYATRDKESTCQCSAPRGPKMQADTSKEGFTLTGATTTETSVYYENTTTARITTQTTNFTTPSNISVIGQNTLLSLLSAGNTTSSRRDNNGFPEGSSPSRNRSAERDITRYHGGSEHNTRDESYEANATHNKENTCCHPRFNSSSIRSIDGNVTRGGGSETTEKSPIYEILYENGTDVEDQNSSREIRGNITDFEIENKDATGGNKRIIPEQYSGGKGGRLSKDQELYLRQPIQSIKNNEKRNNNVPQYHPSYQRLSDGNGAHTTEDQGVLGTNQEKNLKDIPLQLQNLEVNNGNSKKVVMIIDGYSITRGKNGDNKIEKKDIHILS